MHAVSFDLSEADPSMRLKPLNSFKGIERQNQLKKV